MTTRNKCCMGLRWLYLREVGHILWHKRAVHERAVNDKYFDMTWKRRFVYPGQLHRKRLTLNKQCYYISKDIFVFRMSQT
jgi:hypothetical protein